MGYWKQNQMPLSNIAIEMLFLCHFEMMIRLTEHKIDVTFRVATGLKMSLIVRKKENGRILLQSSAARRDRRILDDRLFSRAINVKKYPRFCAQNMQAKNQNVFVYNHWK